MYKSDFPLLTNHPELVYLDSAATTQKPNVVIEAIKHFYENDNANVHRGIYKLSENATDLYEQSRNTIASFINSKPENIIFTSGVTEGMNMIAWGLGEEFIETNSDDMLLMTSMEHHSNLVPWQQRGIRSDVKLGYVKVTKDYRLNLKHLHEVVKAQNVKILALTHMSNTLGSISDLKQIISFMRKNSPQTLIVVDGAQAIAHLPVDVVDLDVDFYAFSGHKIFGPTGIGILYGKSYLLDRLYPIHTGGGMIRTVEKAESTWAPLPDKLEAGTPNIAGAIGLGKAIEYTKHIGIQKIFDYEQELIEYFITKANSTDRFNLFGPNNTKDRGAVFSFEVDGIHAHDLAQLLDEKNIAVRAGHHCTQILMKEVLQVPATVRASFSIYNDKHDIDMLFEGIDYAKTVFSS